MQWLKIIETMRPKWFRINFCCDSYNIRAYSSYLPGYVRGLSMHLSNSSAVIMYSRRLRSEAEIIEVIKHEFIHLEQNNGKHGKEFKRACLELGLDPRKHA